MPGTWIYRDADQHKCDKPYGDFHTKAGDIWECECGEQYRVSKCEYKGDQRDSWYEVSWVSVGSPPLLPGAPSWRD